MTAVIHVRGGTGRNINESARIFKQPESSHNGDCPICFLPLSNDPSEAVMKSCCSKLICKGCDHENTRRELEEESLGRIRYMNLMRRIEANDPLAMYQMGTYGYNAFQYYTKAAELGNVGAHDQFSIMYLHGKGVEINEKKEVYHLEQASIGGHLRSRLGKIQDLRERQNISSLEPTLDAMIQWNILRCFIQGDMSRKMILPWISVDTRLPSMRRRVHRGRREKEGNIYSDSVSR